MADSPATDGAPTTKQTLIVALAMGVLGGGCGGGLGYLLGGQALTQPGETTIEGQGSNEVSPDNTAPATGGQSSVAHAGAEHGEKPAHESAAGAGHPKIETATPRSRPHVISSKLTVRELTPIVTNLADPATNWIRLQSAIVFNPDDLPHPEKIIAELTSDITGYLRTVSLTSLEGADGLRRLQEELSERASIRSNGRIHEFIVETMVVQ